MYYAVAAVTAVGVGVADAGGGRVGCCCRFKRILGVHDDVSICGCCCADAAACSMLLPELLLLLLLPLAEGRCGGAVSWVAADVRVLLVAEPLALVVALVNTSVARFGDVACFGGDAVEGKGIHHKAAEGWLRG